MLLMLCPHCYAETPADLDKCASCGKKIDSGSITYMPSPESEAYSSGFDNDLPLTTMECISRPFKFRNAAAVNMLIGGAIYLIPVIGQVLLGGYLIDYARKVINRDNPSELPDWNRWSEFGVTGLMVFLASLIYMFIFSVMSFAVSVPFWAQIISAGKKFIEQSQQCGYNPNDPATIASLGNPFVTFILALFVPIMIICVIGFAIMLLAPILQVLYARNTNFMDLFNIVSAIKLVMFNIFDFLGIILVMIVLVIVELVAFTIVGGVLAFIPLLGQVGVALLANMVFAVANGVIWMSLMGEFYRKNRTAAEI
jgi:MFS family permease